MNKNRELAKIFYELADFLEIEKETFKSLAYRKAAFSLEELDISIENIFKKGGEKTIEEIPGVGKSIKKKIIEYLKTGKIDYYRKYKKKYPIDISGLSAIEGLGPKKIFKLYRTLKIKNLKELKKAARDGKISKIFNFGEKSEKNILEGIEFLKKQKGKFLLGEVLPQVRKMEKEMEKIKEIEKINVCGSVRRKKETIGDVDFLVMSKNPKKVIDFFCSLPDVAKIWGKGRTKSSVGMDNGLNVDLRVLPEESYGAAMQYFTGSKEHNIKVRKIAIEKKMKLNEYGLFKKGKRLAGKKEEEIYKILGMQCPSPELREGNEEVEACLKNKLPKLVELEDIKGDLHCHSDWDGGENSIEEMAEEAIRRGYEYIGISDHTKFLKIENGLDERQLLKQNKEIEKLNKNLRIFRQGQDSSKTADLKKFQILHGCEANILNDGSLDIKDEVLKKLDYVIAGVHSNLKMPEVKMTERIIGAMRNPLVKIISHPTGRILNKRDEYRIDMGKLMQAAKETNTVLEINASPKRLDLKDINIKKAVGEGVKMIINTDSHHRSQMDFMEYGVFQARRGWAGKNDIINSGSLGEILKFLKTK